MSGTPNQIRPRHAAVLRVLKLAREVDLDIQAIEAEGDPQNDLFDSQLWVWLHRLREELTRAAQLLRDEPEEP